MIEESYGLTTTTDLSPAEAEKAIREGLAEEGFGILTEIDVKTTLATKLGVEFQPYKILGACNPNLAHSALEADERIGLLLPCNVIVAESGSGETVVSVLDPRVMERVADTEAIAEVAREARARLERALAKIS
jgi:uncharacterized protein (DUF302 family)